jgi:Glycosyl transferase family 2
VTVISVIRARNEADVLEATVRHCLQFSSLAIVSLHRCLDNSRQVLDALKQEGLQIQFTEDSGLLHEQTASMSEMISKAAELGADWILPLDADEFLVGDVQNRLSEAEPLVPLAVPWKTYVPLPSEDPAEPNVLKRICHRRKVEQPLWTKVIVPGIVCRERGCSLSFGNHSVVDWHGQPIPSELVQLSMAHFPIRSMQQVCTKVFGGWPSNVAFPERRAGSTFQWKALYETLKANDPVSLDLTRIALEYATSTQWNSLPAAIRDAAGSRRPPDVPLTTAVVHDPVPCTFSVQYQAKVATPMVVLLDCAEAFAMAYGDCRSS